MLLIVGHEVGRWRLFPLRVRLAYRLLHAAGVVPLLLEAELVECV